MPFDTTGSQLQGKITQKTNSPLETVIEGVAAGEPIDVELSTAPTLNVIAALTSGVRFPFLSIGAEAANVIALTVQLQDGLGASTLVATNVFVRLIDANGIDSLAAAFTLADGGAGTLISTTGQASVLATTSAGGTLVLDVTDVVGASGATIYALVWVIGNNDGGGGQGGGFNFIAITFD